MTKNDSVSRCVAPHALDVDEAKEYIGGELRSSIPLDASDTNPWPAIRQAVHAYASDPSDEHALAVEASMLLLRRQRDAA